MDFFKTRMGQRFFDRHVPEFVQQIRTLNQNLGEIIHLLGKKQPARGLPFYPPGPTPVSQPGVPWIGSEEPPKVWMAYHEADETHVVPCRSEWEAYEYLSTRALNQREDVPEGWTVEETIQRWHELTGDEYMRVEGPVRVLQFEVPYQ